MIRKHNLNEIISLIIIEKVIFSSLHIYKKIERLVSKIVIYFIT